MYSNILEVVDVYNAYNFEKIASTKLFKNCQYQKNFTLVQNNLLTNSSKDCMLIR